MHGKPAAYQRSSVLDDLIELLTTRNQMRSMLPTKLTVISIIAWHSGLSATQQSRWDIKEASIRILSTDYRRGLFPAVLHRTYFRIADS